MITKLGEDLLTKEAFVFKTFGTLAGKAMNYAGKGLRYLGGKTQIPKTQVAGGVDQFRRATASRMNIYGNKLQQQSKTMKDKGIWLDNKVKDLSGKALTSVKSMLPKTNVTPPGPAVPPPVSGQEATGAARSLWNHRGKIMGGAGLGVGLGVGNHVYNQQIADTQNAVFQPQQPIIMP